jgi:hypothetical protein
MQEKMGLLYLLKAILFMAIAIICTLIFEAIKTVFALTVLSLQFFFVWLINLPKTITQPRKI